MSQKILLDQKLISAAKKGITTGARPVRLTMGPRGGNFMVRKHDGERRITNDGDSILKGIKIENAYESMYLKGLQSTVAKANKETGDGSSACTAIYEDTVIEALKLVSMGVNATLMIEGMKKAVEDVLEALKKLSRPIKNRKELLNVVASSAESKERAEMIIKAIEAVGKDGRISIEESSAIETKLEVLKGFSFDSGYASGLVVNKPESSTAEYLNPGVMVIGFKINTENEVVNIMEKAVAKKLKSLLLIADDFSEEVLYSINFNLKMPDGIKVIPVRSPGYGESKKDILEDICIATGSKLLTEGDLETDITLADFGSAKQIIVTKDSATIIDGKGSKEKIAERVSLLKSQSKGKISEYEQEMLAQRMQSLTGKAAVISIGATTDEEIGYLKDKFDDALSTAKHAAETGIVPGGGSALLWSRWSIDTKFLDSKSLEFRMGYNLVLNVTYTPFCQIVSNAGDDAKIIIGEVKSLKKTTGGYDAKKRVIVEDVYESGIADAFKVVELAFKYAVEGAMLVPTIIGASE